MYDAQCWTAPVSPWSGGCIYAPSQLQNYSDFLNNHHLLFTWPAYMPLMGYSFLWYCAPCSVPLLGHAGSKISILPSSSIAHTCMGSVPFMYNPILHTSWSQGSVAKQRISDNANRRVLEAETGTLLILSSCQLASSWDAARSCILPGVAVWGTSLRDTGTESCEPPGNLLVIMTMWEYLWKIAH